jgi:glutaminyl-tRNA synthetase
MLGSFIGELMSNFIEREIEKFRAENPDRMIVTRFPPEPNGRLHIGHAKSIVLNFELAKKYGGRCYLRLDDTNPETENSDFVMEIISDVEWLGYKPDSINYASEYFPLLYNVATEMTLKGMAYVCTHDEEEIAEYKGTVKKHGTPCSCRSNSVEDNIALLNKMYRGKFKEEEAVLRAKIDLSSDNMKMRDPIMYRVKHASHHRTGDFWKIYPMYDFAHCLSDSIEGITHSICTLEFDNNRELYDWYVDAARTVHELFENAVNKQYEMARLNLENTELSKRKLAALVYGHVVEGWDDPVMPTISGMRRRGVPPETIRKFVMELGISKADNSVASTTFFNSIIRDHLNDKAPRIMGALRPLSLSINGLTEMTRVKADHWPRDIDKSEVRELELGPRVWIDRTDFAIEAPPKWRRLAPGRTVRLKSGCIVTCTGYETDEDGNVTEVYADLVPGSIGGAAPEGVKPKGTITWVPFFATRVLFHTTAPLFLNGEVNSNHTEHFKGVIEPGDYRMGERYQIERNGYFMVSITKWFQMVEIVPLKESWK